jgi:serine/threonine protein kinase
MYLILNEDKIAFADEVPEEFRKVVLRCLEKDPRNRYRDFGELLADITIVRDRCKDGGSEVTPKFSGLSAYAERGAQRNPYLNRVMIANPSEFFGRDRDIRRIYSRLDAQRPQSISVVGERRIGKSSSSITSIARNRKEHMRNHAETTSST